MKSVMISIRPKWCRLIANGKKTVEVRKTKPKIEIPFRCYIYCTNAAPYLVYGDRFDGGSFVSQYEMLHGYSREDAVKIWGEVLNGKVIGEFVCDLITGLKANNQIQAYYNGTQGTCLSPADIVIYAAGKMIYYWRISDLVIYDKPKELSEFRSYNPRVIWEEGYPLPTHAIQRPPQSWCYVEEVE